MRKTVILLLLISTLAFTKAVAQITINQNALPELGDTIDRGKTNNIDTIFDPYTKVLNPTWDCTWLRDDDDNYPISYFMDATKHPLTDSFPGATIVQIEDTIEIFGITNNNGYSGIGASLFNQVGRFRTQPEFIKIPREYGDDPWQSTGFLKAASSLGPLKFEFTFLLQRDIETVNYGTVLMPDQKSYDVIVNRVKEVYSDTTVTENGGVIDSNYRNDTTIYYEFIGNDFPLPLLRCATDDNGKVVSIEYVYTGVKSPIGIDDNVNQNIALYPNPVKSNLRVNLPDKMLITIVDAQGKTLLHSTYSAGENTIDVNHLPNGLLFVQFSDRNGAIITRKMISKL